MDNSNTTENGNLGFILAIMLGGLTWMFGNADVIFKWVVGTGSFGAAVMGMITSGLDNTGMGHVAFQVLSTGSSNCAFGGGALNGLTTGSQNVAVGLNAAEFVQTGSNNTALGFNAGNSWGIASANNINIGNVGASESATIRIGTNATHTNTYIAGIDGVNVGSVAKVLTMASDHIGTASIVAGTGVTVTAGANTITIAATGTTSLTYTNVNTTPYVVLATDEYLSVDTSALAITIQLPNAATLGRVFIIKDRSGAAATRNITVTTVGGAVNIDGATSFVMNTNFQSIQVIGNGSTYEVF